jgi:solute carrier family 25 carnitine/acylcarnitine transporter 20/29
MQLDNITKKQFQGSFHCVKTLVGAHGPQILYTGHVVNTVREATFVGNYFFVYEGMREFFIANHLLGVQVAVPVSGGLAGAFSWFISFPLDCIRAGVQGQPLPPIKSAPQVFRQLINERGIRGLYSGASASIARAFLVSGSRFSAYEGALWLLRGGRNYERHHG